MFVPNDMCVINEREIVALFYIQYIDSKAAEPCHVNMGRIVMFSTISNFSNFHGNNEEKHRSFNRERCDSFF